jgi:hypothetical protein
MIHAQQSLQVLTTPFKLALADNVEADGDAL